MRRILLLLALTAAALALPSVPHASACSCISLDIREQLPEADGAFVGALLSHDDPQPVNGTISSATLVPYRFQVERVVKGEVPGGIVEVWSSWSGASCGLETPPGQRTGLLLRRDGDRWTSGLCWQADPDVLLRAGEPLPPPAGKAPPAVVVGTTHGPGRILSLDGSGQIVAYGDGNGTVSDVAFCPGGETLAEAYTSPGANSYHRPGVAVRSVGDLRLSWERFLFTPEQTTHTSIADVACPAPGADEVLALTVEDSYTDTASRHTARIVAYRKAGDPKVLWQGEGTGGTFSTDGTAAYVTVGPDGSALVHVDLADRSNPGAHRVARVPSGASALAIAPGGRHLAGVTSYVSGIGPGSDPSAKAFVVDLAASPATVVDTRLSSPTGRYNAVLWSGPDRLLVVPDYDGSVLLFDPVLRTVGSWPGWGSSHATVAGGRLLGLAGPKVLSAPASTGPAAQWADLESGVPGTIAAVPVDALGTRSEAPANPPKSSTTTASAPATTTSAAPTSATSSTTAPPESAPEPIRGQEVVALPEHDGGGTGGRPILAGGAGAVLLAAGAAGLLRHRRVPKLPPL